MTTKKTLKERFEIAMENEFKRIFEGDTIKGYVEGEFEKMRQGIVWAYLGIERSWRELEFTHDSRVKKSLEKANLPVDDFIKSLSLNDIEFTAKDIKELKASYKNTYMGKLEDLVRHHAQIAAEMEFEKLVDELGIRYVESAIEESENS